MGPVAAQNAISDVYAMGGRPIFALNVVTSRVGAADCTARRGARGRRARATEAGIAVLGGHSVDDPEPKYGLVVVGEVHPDRIADATPGCAAATRWC